MHKFLLPQICLISCFAAFIFLVLGLFEAISKDGAYMAAFGAVSVPFILIVAIAAGKVQKEEEDKKKKEKIEVC